MAGEIDRILALPVKANKKPPDLTRNFRKRGGAMTLRPVQSEILYEAAHSNGLLGLVGVGEGKTLASMLLPHVIKREDGSPVVRPLLLIPAAMRAQCIHDWQVYQEHFLLPASLMVRSYEEISNNTSMLRQLQPDLIICDEAHKLRNLDASRTKRVSRYMRSQKPRFVALSGTLTATTVKDFAHLAKWALDDGSPLPNRLTYLNSWAACLDRDGRASPGDKMAMTRLIKKFGGDAREAFQKRLETTRGVVLSKNTGPPCSLIIDVRKPEPDDKIEEYLDQLDQTWTTPGGEELDSALSFTRACRQIACGFYYVWKWKDDIVDEPWLEARAEWNRAVRRTLAKAGEGYDSPSLLAAACQRLLEGEPERLPRSLVQAYQNWLPQKDKPLPPVAARWFSDSFINEVRAAVETSSEPPIIWYGHQAVAMRLQRALGFPVFGPGKEASEELVKLTHPTPIIASLSAHATGKNLQMFGDAIFAHPLSDGARYEQALGRHHRQGQKRDEVTSTVFAHRIFDKAFQQAQNSAAYIEETTGLPQRLRYANYRSRETKDEADSELS